MEDLVWQNIDADIKDHIEVIIFPGILARTLARLYYDGVRISESYDVYYNTVKNYFNIIDENKLLILEITEMLLYKRYDLKIISENPLEFKREL